MHKLEVLNNGISERPVPVKAVVLVEGVMPVVKVEEEVDGLGRTLSIYQLGSASMMRLGLYKSKVNKQ